MNRYFTTTATLAIVSAGFVTSALAWPPAPYPYPSYPMPIPAPYPGPAPAPYPTPNFANPDVYRTTSSSAVYNPYTGRWEVQNDIRQIQASAYDPNRGVVDPGSLRAVNRLAQDGFGNTVREVGYEWTSYGRPHAEIKKVEVNNQPGFGGFAGIGSTTTTTTSRASSFSQPYRYEAAKPQPYRRGW